MGLVLKTFAMWIPEVFVSKSLTWQLLSTLFVADVNCRAWVCLNTQGDLEKPAFSRILNLCIL